ncbi:vitamin B12 dependent-methionine synthase activation domain-containing protein [Bacteroidota bacterium]
MINIKEFSINLNEININPKDISKIIGYKEGEIPEMIDQEIESVLSEINKNCSLKGGYRIIENVQFDKESTIVQNITFHTKGVITNFLKGSDSIAILVCTAGKEISDWTNNLFKENNSLKAYVVDVAASIMVEKAADVVQSRIEKLIKSNLKKITNRYSPGYCDWELKEQFKLFSLLPDNFCGIQLNEEALMLPTKSISAIIGIGNKVEKKAYQCDVCNRKDCIYKLK